ncbi:MAG: cyclophilin-like fold protein [Candidatus Nezhaarchaeales archaeon]
MKNYKIEISIGSFLKAIGEITLEENPKTAQAVVSALPFESTVERWGDEVYFVIPVRVEAENARINVKVGEIAYWPEEPSLCIFFGPTPVSPSPSDIRAYSPVSVIGRLLSNPLEFKRVRGGEKVRVKLLKA